METLESICTGSKPTLRKITGNTIRINKLLVKIYYSN